MPEGFDQFRALDESIGQLAGKMRAERKEEKIVRIAVDKIRPNPFQPRRRFDQTALEELAKSIRTDGLNEPIIVRKIAEENTDLLFELIAGERRLRAVKLLGEPVISAIVKDYDDRRTKRIGLVENIQRENLNTVEIACGIRLLMDDHLKEHDGNTDERKITSVLAEEIGKDRKTVERYLRIYEGIHAVAEVEELFRRHSDRISFRDARDYAAVAERLRSLKKSNNREYGRILKKLTKGFSDRKDKDAVKKSVGYLQRYFGKERDKASHSAPNERMFHETEEKVVLNIEVVKSSGVSAEERERMEGACRQFLERLHAVSAQAEKAEWEGE
ncbi:MAG TPA: ParB/RepB/Spo0J family partition protein [Dissulfurispiraceae bacterium]